MKKIHSALLVVAVVGMIAAIVMTKMHYRVAQKGFEEKSFCHLTEFIDCDTALASSYSSIKTQWGLVPTSELGVLYYLLVLAGVLYAAFSPGGGRATLSFLFGSSFFAVGYSAVMAYLSIARLGVLCLLCLTTYLANLFLFLLLPKALGIHYAAVPRFLAQYVASFFKKGEARPRPVFHLGVTLLLLVVGLVFFRGLNPKIHKAYAEIPKADYLRIFNSLPQTAFDIGDRPFWGSKEAPVTIVEFSDFQCPFCRMAAFTLKPYLKEFRNSVRLVFFNYPLDNSCNPAIKHAMHSSACLAAKASICGAQMGNFWDYHDRIFENQKKLSREKLLALAVESGMDRNRFEQCLVSDETAERLKNDLEQGNKVEIRGTPTVFVNGRLFRDWTNRDRLKMVIESQLGKK